MPREPDQPEQPVQTDNRPRPEDGEQDLPQAPGSIVGTVDLTAQPEGGRP